MALVFSKDFLYVSARRDYGDEDESINEKEAYPVISLFSWCDPLGARTQDPNIKSVVLYQLS